MREKRLGREKGKSIEREREVKNESDFALSI